MKKILAALIALVLLASVPMVSLAEITYSVTPTDSFSVSMGSVTNTYVLRGSEGYQVFSADGTALSAAYGNITVRDYGRYYEVANENGVNNLGLLDVNGVELLPTAYGDFEYLNENWVLAYELAPAEGDVGEYTYSGTGEKYNVLRTDVLYKGKIIGSLTRDDYIKSYYTGVRGDFMYVKTSSSSGYWLDSQFNRNDITDVDFFSTSEYDDIYKKGVKHNPTGQWAFVADCTLTPDQVDQTLWYDSSKGNLYDLQGNLIAAGLPYDSIRYRGDYLLIRQHGLYGIMDSKGNVVAEPAYAEVAGNDKLFLSGYTAVVDEKGALSYLSTDGTVTASVPYQLSSSDYKGFIYNAPFVAVKNMGLYTIITATSGELAEKYQDISTPRGSAKVMSVQKDDMWGVIDMEGNTVLPFVFNYPPEISVDGSLILGRDSDTRDYNIYRLDAAASETDDSAPYDRVTKMSGELDEDVPAETAEGWTCTCGGVNTGKFCTECGAAQPVEEEAPAEDGSWACASCQATNTGKFCTECGSAKPEEAADPTCASCGYDPGAETPKFCPECGAKFE